MKVYSEIEWPSSLTAIPEMCYESIVPLYTETRPELSGENFGFALSCSKHFTDPNGCRGCIQKLEVVADPNFAQAKMKISHEVLPNKGACSQLLPINDKLRVACFDQGCIIAIKNFGYKKTFNCDVRGALQNHSSPVNCIANDMKGTQLASGTTDGEIGLYQVREERIFFLSKQSVSSTFVSGLAYLQPKPDICTRPRDDEVLNGENMLIYSTRDGYLGLIDTRCKLAAEVDCSNLDIPKPRLNISTLCYMDTPSGQIVYLGTAEGQVISMDLRCIKKFLYQQNLPEDKCIRRMKEITIIGQDQQKKRYLAYTNGTRELKIVDAQTAGFHTGWTCDRLPGAIIKDFCQVGNRIVTCGAETSIGCWTWLKS